MNKYIQSKLNKINQQAASSVKRSVGGVYGGGYHGPIRGVDGGGATRAIEVDENGNLRVDLVSGVSVSTVIDQTNSLMVNQVSGSVWSVSTPDSIIVEQVSGSSFSVNTYNVRGSTVTGYASLVLAQETAIMTGISGTFIGLTTVTGSNTSGAALQVDIRTGTAGTVVDSLVIPATSIVSKAYEVPMPQSEVQQIWTAKVNSSGELSDSPVTITMIGIKQL